MQELFSKLKKKRVETKSGVYLGKIRDIVFDLDSQVIRQYIVGKRVLPDDFTIHRNQIVAFEEDKIVVDDNVETESIKKENETIIPEAGMVTMREEG